MAYTAAVFKELGHEVSVYNADFADSDYSNLIGLIDGQDNYLDYFDNKDHPLWTEVAEKILEFEPDTVGYTCYTANIPAINIIQDKLLNRYKFKGKQIVGGSHTRICGSGAILDLPQTKTIYTGESESILSSDSRPFPNREDFWGVTKEQEKQIDLSYIITSRGCPYKCTFCANPNMWGNNVRFRSVDSVISELKEMRDTFSVREVYILDDTFTLNSKRVKALMQRMIDENLGMSWRCNTRLDRLDDEICDLMKKSGCIEAKVGVETGSERIFKLIKKGETKEDIREGIKLLKQSGIPITAYFLTGFPGETDNDLKETIDFAQQLDIDRYSLSVFSPYYGSELFYDLQKQGKLDNIPYQYFYHQSARPLANDILSDFMLEKYFALSDLNKDKRYDK